MTTTKGPLVARPVMEPVSDRILKAARDEFLLVGIRRARMGEICRAARCSRATVNERFGDKQKLVEAVLWQEVRSGLAQVSTATAGARNDAERVVRMVGSFVAMLRSSELGNRLTVTDPDELFRLGRLGALDSVRAIIESNLPMPADDSGTSTAARAELVARLLLCLAIAPNGVLPYDNDEAVTAFSRDYLVPYVMDRKRTLARGPVLPPRGSMIDFEVSDAVTARILDAAFDEFARVGIRRASMVSIAKAAECSRATLYRRYPEKDELTAALVTREVARTMHAIDAAIGDDARTRALGVDMTVVVMREIRTHPILVRVLELEPELIFGLIRDGTAVSVGRDFIAQYLEGISGDPELIAEILARVHITYMLYHDGIPEVDSDAAARRYAEVLLAPLAIGRPLREFVLR